MPCKWWLFFLAPVEGNMPKHIGLSITINKKLTWLVVSSSSNQCPQKVAGGFMSKPCMAAPLARLLAVSGGNSSSQLARESTTNTKHHQSPAMKRRMPPFIDGAKSKKGPANSYYCCYQYWRFRGWGLTQANHWCQPCLPPSAWLFRGCKGHRGEEGTMSTDFLSHIVLYLGFNPIQTHFDLETAFITSDMRAFYFNSLLSYLYLLSLLILWKSVL